MMENHKFNLERVDRWIQNADVKANILLFLQSGLLVFTLKEFFLVLSDSGDLFHFRVILGIAFLTILGDSIYHVLRALFPSLGCEVKRNIFFFCDVAKLKVEDFKDVAKKATEKDIEELILNQIHANSEIASKKFEHIKDATFLTIVSIFLFLIIFLINFLENHGVI